MTKPRIHLAVEFAYEAHQGQVRKSDGTPYVYHVLRVGRLLFLAGFSPDVVAAGILHDVIEDTPFGFSDLDRVFGQEVASLVGWVTETKGLPSWQARKEAYLTRLANAPMEARAVAMADKLDNLGDTLRQGNWSAFRQSKTHQVWFYRKAFEVCQGVHPDFDRDAKSLTKAALR